MTKAETRKVALRQRRNLSQEEVTALSLRLLTQFSTLDFSQIGTIHLFIPIEEKNEPNTFLFIDWLTLNHPEIKIIVPRADFDTALMTHHQYTHKDDLQKNIYNILEPAASDGYYGQIDLVLVPLLAFDLRGYRVGYGKGFYDRFLENVPAKKIGLSFFENVDIIEDIHDSDIRLDFCITPERIFYFEN